MSFGFLDPWHRFLPRDPQHVVALMGSGGKTSLMLALAAQYREWGVPVVLTTTTRTEALDGLPSYSLAALADCTEPPASFFLYDRVGPDGKWLGLPPDQVDALGGRFPDRVVLVEVDGAAKKPLKLHLDGEPVWPARTSLALLVMGTTPVGAPVGKQLHRWGEVFWPPLAGLNDWTIWEWKHHKTLLLDRGGYLDQVPEDVPVVLALTGMDQQEDSIGLFGFCGEAMAEPRLPLVMLCALGEETAVIRTAWREETEAP
jgi:probable selenium-dependent hydroxylase accessory protein YqeC